MSELDQIIEAIKKVARARGIAAFARQAAVPDSTLREIGRKWNPRLSTLRQCYAAMLGGADDGEPSKVRPRRTKAAK